MKITRPYALPLFKLLGIHLRGKETDIQKNAQSHPNSYNLFTPYRVPKKICLILVGITEE